MYNKHQSRIASMTTITAVFVLFLALPAAVVKSCKYPDFVQNNPKDKQDFWATRIQYGVPKEILRVSGGIVKGYAQPANGTAPSITVTCRQQVGNATRAKYITVVERRNRAKVYVCVQILRRTPDILQLKLGPFKNTSNISLCDDSLMTIYGNLLVANKKKDRSWQFCGLQGGFYFTGKTGDDVPGQSMKDLCPMSPFPSRVDAECLKGEGIRFAFPYEECIPPATGWSRDQTIQCSGTWIEGNNRFSVLNSPKGLYCMKYPSKNQRGGDQFTAYIYPYLTCPTGEPAPGTPVIQLNMTQSDTIGCQDDIDRNICKEKKKLGLCSSSLFATYCRLSCGICASDCFDKWGATLCKIFKDVHLCKFVGSHGCMKTCGLCESKSSFNLSDEKGPAFMRSLRGKWLAPLGEKVRHNQISARTFTVEDFGSFRLNSSLDSLSYVLRQTPGETRGCLPRYLCAKFNRKTKPVLSYKLSQSVITFKDKRDVCESSQFRDDPQPLGETFRSKYMKNLISANPRWLNETTLCGFGGNFTFNMTIQSPGSKIKRTCTGNFTDNQNCKDLQSIESNIACQGGFIGHYNSLCLARWRSTSNSSRFLITAIPQQSSHATCLIIPHKGKDAYVMPAALCNEEVERYVITGKTKPLARITKKKKVPTAALR